MVPDRPPTGSLILAEPREVPAVWGNVPQRNMNFTGREALLGELRRRVTGEVTAVLAHALHGMGGVGKTQLAVEYAYRHMADYQVIWWVPADPLHLVRSSLAALAPRLGLEDVVPGRVEDAVNSVRDALRRGEPYERWLVVFDNVDQPEDILDLLPHGPGHVIVTSRNHRWRSQADVVEVDVFSRPESLAFLGRRVEGVAPDDAMRLADELGDLPLALEQAAALQVEMAISVDEYLELLRNESGKVLAEGPPADYHVSVAAAWALSVARLREQTPFAWELARRCAFLGPEPISRELLKSGRHLKDSPLTEVGDTIHFGRATRELGRYALARVDLHNQTLQIHRLIQKLFRDEMTPEEAQAIRHEVHLLLAAADPDEPDDLKTWPSYDDLLAHALPAGVASCRDHAGRRLVRNLVRYLFNVGDLHTCDTLSREGLSRWTAESGVDDEDSLILAGHRANLLWTQGEYREAYQLRRTTLEHMRSVLGEEHEETLLVTSDHGADLRARGEFGAALELDSATLRLHKRVFGDHHPQTFMVANNLAVDYGLNSEYSAAHETNARTYRDRLAFYGRNDHPWVIHSLSSIGRDLRQGGKYAEALQVEEQAFLAFAELVRQHVLPGDHPWVLWQGKDLSVARRKMAGRDPGFLTNLTSALALAVEVYEKYVASFGEGHPDTLSAGMNLGNAKRVYGDVNQSTENLIEADKLVEATYELYEKTYGDDHPYTYGCALNLAIVRRRTGQEKSARSLLQAALEGLRERLGDNHHYTLTCMTALATSLSATGDVQAAVELGQVALDGLRRLLGSDHPHALACANNLTIDLQALDQAEAADELRTDTLDRYRGLLPRGHLDRSDAEEGKRVALDFEPPPL